MTPEIVEFFGGPLDGQCRAAISKIVEVPIFQGFTATAQYSPEFAERKTGFYLLVGVNGKWRYDWQGAS